MAAPLLEKIKKIIKEKYYRFHIPGHGQGKGLPAEFRALAPELFKADLTELPGLDDLHNPRGVIARAQQQAAHLYGAEETFFLVNGTTCGIQALVAAAAREGERVLVPRNAHRSVLSGLVWSGAVPVYLQPQIVPFFEFPAGISSRELAGQLDSCPAGRAVLLVHPTYYGTVGDLESLVHLARGQGLPVIADEAHGTHLYFGRDFPAGALQCGVDAAVQSVHKTGGSLTQSSWLHLQGKHLDRDRVRKALALFQTTSPSYLLMSSLDAAREQLESQGGDIMDKVSEYSRQATRSISEIKGLVLLNRQNAGGAVRDTDPSRLVISVRGLGLTGYYAREILRRHRAIELEMADFNNIIAVIGPGTTGEEVDMLVKALRELAAGEYRDRRFSRRKPALPPVPPLRLTPRQAWMSGSRPVPLAEATGKVSAEMACVYPPGIPAVCPGEEITAEVREYLEEVRGLGLHCQGPVDPGLQFIKVIE